MASSLGNLQLIEAERRRDDRRAVLLRADVHLTGRLPLLAHAVDVSPGGLGLLSPETVDIDEQISVSVPFDVAGELHTVVITGKVRYCRKQADNCYRVGLQFVNVDEQTAGFIAAICR